jgi:hypothetical protein
MVASIVMAWTGAWHPRGCLLVLAICSIVGLSFPITHATPTIRRRRLETPSLVVLGLVAIAILLWALSLGDIPTSGLSDFGLPPRLPILWYAGLVCAFAGCLASIFLTRSAGVAAAAIGGLVLVLFGTVPALGQPPQYSWTYKHIGVVELVEAAHGVPFFTGDIYQRWPGFFTATAIVAEASGRADPMDYAGWSEPLFALIDALLLAALARSFRLNRTACWGAALLFTSANWVGQTYFSPQALAFALYLAFFVLLLQHAVPTKDRSLLDRAGVLVKGPKRRHESRPTVRLPAFSPPGTTVALLVLLQVCISISHQLTPYLLVLGLAALAMSAPVRPRWLWPVIAAIPLIYLLPHLPFIQDNWGIFTGFHIRNVLHDQSYGEVPSAGKAFNTLTGRVLTAVVWVGGLAAIIAGFRGQRRDLRLLGGLFVSPFLLVLGQNYGGEASLRVFLFTLPWAVLAISAAALGAVRRVWHVGWAALSLVVLVLFVPTFYGQAEINFMSTDEVQASEAIYRYGRPGGVLMLAAPNFPRAYGYNYAKYEYASSDPSPSLLKPLYFRDRALGSPEDVDHAIALMKQIAPYGFLVFGSSGFTYADVFHLAPPGQLQRLEHAVAADSRFKVFASSRDVRVYSWGKAVAAHVATPVPLPESN